MSAVKLISLNIERSKHLDRIMPFLESEQPDVLCLMELCEDDIPQFERAVGPCKSFAPIMQYASSSSEQAALVGNGVFSMLPGSAGAAYYRGSESGARTLPPKRVMEDLNLVRFDFEKSGLAFRIIATHFTWTPDGKSSPQQFIDLDALCGYLDTCEEFVLCGDFNAPRGGEVFSRIADRYRDNIPPEYEGSIDVTLHRAGHLASEEMDKKMVDGLFTTPAYRAEDVHLVDKVSDHMAIVARISRN